MYAESQDYIPDRELLISQLLPRFELSGVDCLNLHQSLNALNFSKSKEQIACVDVQAGLLAALFTNGTFTITDLNDESEILHVRLSNPHKTFIEPRGRCIIVTCTDGDVHTFFCSNRNVSLHKTMVHSRYENAVITSSTSSTLKITDRHGVQHHHHLIKRAIIGEFIAWLPEKNVEVSTTFNYGDGLCAVIYSKVGGFAFGLRVSNMNNTKNLTKAQIQFLFQLPLSTLSSFNNASLVSQSSFISSSASDDFYVITGAAACFVNNQPILLVSTLDNTLYRVCGDVHLSFQQLINRIANGDLIFEEVHSHDVTELDSTLRDVVNKEREVTHDNIAASAVLVSSSKLTNKSDNYYRSNSNAINLFYSSVNTSPQAYVWVNNNEIVHGLFENDKNTKSSERPIWWNDYILLLSKISQRTINDHSYEMEEELFSESSSLPWVNEQHMLFVQSRVSNSAQRTPEHVLCNAAVANTRTTSNDTYLQSNVQTGTVGSALNTSINFEFVNKPPLQVVLTAFHMLLLYEERFVVIKHTAGLPPTYCGGQKEESTLLELQEEVLQHNEQRQQQQQQREHRMSTRSNVALESRNTFGVTEEWLLRQLRFDPFRHAHVSELLRSSTQLSGTANNLSGAHYFKGMVRDIAHRKTYVYNSFAVWELQIEHEADQQWRVFLNHALNAHLSLPLRRRCFDAAERLLSFITYHDKRAASYHSPRHSQPHTEQPTPSHTKGNTHKAAVMDVRHASPSERDTLELYKDELLSTVQYLRGKFYLSAGAVEHATSILIHCNCLFEQVYNMLRGLHNQRVLEQFLLKKFVYSLFAHREMEHEGTLLHSNKHAKSSESILKAQQERARMQAGLIVMIIEHKLRMLQQKEQIIMESHEEKEKQDGIKKAENEEEEEEEDEVKDKDDEEELRLQNEERNRLIAGVMEFVNYAIEHSKVLFRNNTLYHTLTSMIEQYGHTSLAIHLALKTNRPVYALRQYLVQGAFHDAIRILVEHTEVNCQMWYEAAPMLMSGAPVLFVSALLKQLKRDERAQRKASFDISHLLPLLLHYSAWLPLREVRKAYPFRAFVSKSNVIHVNKFNNRELLQEEHQLIVLLEEYINTYNCTLPSVHNCYLLLLTSHIAEQRLREANKFSNNLLTTTTTTTTTLAVNNNNNNNNNNVDNIRLETFLHDSVYYNVDFALRMCWFYKCYAACVTLYTRLHRYDDAVRVALNYSSPTEQGNWNELTNIEATLRGIRGFVNSEITLKRLWLQVVECVMEKCGMHAALRIVEDSNGVLLLEDVLANFKKENASVPIEEFKDAMCSTLNKYQDTVHNLRQQQQEAYEAKMRVEAELDALQHKFSYITQRQLCLLCHQVLLSRTSEPIIVYPNCQHVVHESCAVARLEEMGGLEAFITDACLPQHVLHQITDLASLARVDCVICGEAAIVEVDIPLCWDDPSWEV